MSANNPRVAVIGSVNLDAVAQLGTQPEVGATITASAFEERGGGKGANQAHAAARGGATTTLIAAVGRDMAAHDALEDLRGLVTTALQTTETPTGRALVWVGPEGDNTIVVIPGANERLDEHFVQIEVDQAQPDVVLAQLEVDLTAVNAAARWAQRAGRRFMLNASPAAQLPLELLTLCDPLVVNETEARFYLRPNEPPERVHEPLEIAQQLSKRCRSAIVTAGAAGAAYAAAEGARMQPADAADVVDTTGAGDAFAGALAAALAADTDWPHAMTVAAEAAAEATTWHGARPTPTRE